MANYYGIAGWSYPDWKGIVYPPDAPRGFDELSYISNFFDVIELNNTFYRIPESKVVENWVKRVGHNQSFKFTVKIYQGFTHEQRPVDEGELRQFYRVLDPLKKAGCLGAVLAQFPASFKNTEQGMGRLEDLALRLKDYPLTVEFRHRSWATPGVYRWLEENAVSFCNVDEPVFQHLLRPSALVTGPVGYVRFHGRNYASWYSKEGGRDARYNYLYSESELDQWIPRIQEMGKKATDVYVIGNNHFRGQAPANILQLKAKTIQGPVNVPESMFQAFPDLEKIAVKKRKKAGQRSLFEESP